MDLRVGIKYLGILGRGVFVSLCKHRLPRTPPTPPLLTPAADPMVGLFVASVRFEFKKSVVTAADRPICAEQALPIKWAVYANFYL